jgi:hypothetical protein
MTQAKAEKYLKVPKNLMESLIKIGMIRRYRHSTSVHGYRFSKAELDQFLERLLLDATPVASGAEGMMSISRATFHCRAKVSDIIQMIFDRKLRRVGHRQDLAGFQSVVIDSLDVKNAHDKPLDGMSVAAAGSKLQIHTLVLHKLIQRGVLKASHVRHPISNRPSLRIDHLELERFDAEYTTAFNLARPLKQDVVKLRKSLAAKGIKPAEETLGLETTFYRRSDLQ